MDMIDSDDPAFLSEDETRLTRLFCPERGGELLRWMPQVSYFASRAAALRSQVQAWSSHPAQLDTPPE